MPSAAWSSAPSGGDGPVPGRCVRNRARVTVALLQKVSWCFGHVQGRAGPAQKPEAASLTTGRGLLAKRPFLPHVTPRPHAALLTVAVTCPLRPWDWSGWTGFCGGDGQPVSWRLPAASVCDLFLLLPAPCFRSQAGGRPPVGTSGRRGSGAHGSACAGPCRLYCSVKPGCSGSNTTGEGPAGVGTAVPLSRRRRLRPRG